MTIETGVTLMAIASAFAAAIFSYRLKAARSNGYAYSYMRGGSRRKHVAGTWEFKFDLIIFRIWIAIYSFCSLVMFLGVFFGNVR
jgi:hypothetical protein